MRTPYRPLVAALFALTPLHHAGGSGVELTLLVTEGDVVPHFGQVDYVNGLEVNSNGEWIVVLAQASNPAGGSSAALRNGELDLVLGMALSSPPGATCVGMLEGQLDDDGNLLRRMWIDPADGPEIDAYYWNDESLVLTEGQVSLAPEFPSPHVAYWFWIQDRGGKDLVAMASSFETSLGAYVGEGITTFRIADNGRLYDEHKHVLRGDIAPKFGLPISRIVTNPHTIALNASRQLMYIVQLEGAQTANDYAIYLDDEPIAVEGRVHRPSGLDYHRLQSANVTLNDRGDHAFTATLINEHDKTIDVLLRNFEIYAAEGETFPTIAPSPLYRIVGHPLLAETGELFWIGRWKQGEVFKTGLFRNRELLVEAFVSTAGGQLIESMGHYSSRLAVSDDGHWAIVEATIEGDREAAILVHAP